MSIGKQINIGIAVGLALLILADSISVTRLSQLIQSARAVIQTSAILDELDALLLQVQNAEASQRGYIITANEIYLEPYYKGLRSVGAHVTKLRENFTNRPTPTQAERLASLESLISEKFTDMDGTIRAIRDGRHEEAQRHVRTGLGRRTMDDIRKLMSDIKTEESTALVEGLQQVEAAAGTTIGTIVIATLVGIAILAVAAFVIRRNLAAQQKADQQRIKLEESLRQTEKMSAMGILVAGVAHAVRNPLFGISATLDAMEARFRGRQEYDKYVATLRRECDRMVKLMQQLLIYGRPPTTQPMRASLPDVVAEALETTCPMAERSKVSIASAIAGKLVLAPIERDRLLMILQNLLENAIQHSPPKAEVKITVIQIHEENRTWFQCTVEDSGPGFSPEDLLNVFEPFYSRRSGGTGLGLSIVRQTVEQVGGKIWAGNRPKGGAMVIFRLPAVVAQEDVNVSEYSAHRG